VLKARLLSKLNNVSALILAMLLIGAGAASCLVQAEEPPAPGGPRQAAVEPAPEASEAPAIPAEQLVQLHRLIRPQPGELRFHEIPWLLSVWEARKKAAEEGKPILVWAGSGGAPIGGC
jgi:hypothetical protein